MSQSPLEELRATNTELQRWLLERALPFWDEYGVDRAGGGFFEELGPASGSGGIEAAGTIRRGRVVARQLFVFDLGHRLGWYSSRSDPVAHGCEYLFSRMCRSDGLFHSAVNAATGDPVASFSLYEHAFYLFALARLQGNWGHRFPLEDTAARCLLELTRQFHKAEGGFEESVPPTLPLKSNPHMHLLEASLEWIGAATPERRAQWVALSRELVDLCLHRFIDARTGAVREYFSADWNPAPGPAGRILEPGHQFEWAWLLLRWADFPDCGAPQRTACIAAARRLVDLAERAGVDARRGVAINELWDDLTVKDEHAKLWPQTERLKAWCAMLAHATDPTALHAQIALAARGLAGYLVERPAGLWRESLSTDGAFGSEPCKASSFYHVACALDTLRETLYGPADCGIVTGFNIAADPPQTRPIQ